MGVQIPQGYGIARHLLQLTGRPTPYVVTMGFDHNTDFDGQAAANSKRDIWSAANRPFSAALMLAGYTYLGCEVTVMLQNGPVGNLAAANIAGTQSGAALPPNCAMLVKKVTARGGRKGRGRMFVPPIATPESNVDTLGLMSSATVTTIQAAWSSAINAEIASDYPPRLLHETLVDTPDAITGLIVSGQIATQRRRMR